MRKQLSKIWTVIGVSLMVICFQNCSDMVVQDSVIWSASLAEYQKALDQKKLPSLLNTQGSLSFWSKPGASNYVHKDPVFADSWSYVVALNRSSTGTVFSVNSNSNSEEGRLTVVNGMIRASRINDVSNYAYVETPIPASGDRMVIGATFKQAAGDNDIELMVNGVIQKTARQKVGTPFDFSWIQKSVETASSIESVVYAEAIDLGGLNVMSRYVASSENIGNVIYDPALMSITDGGSVGGSDPYLAAAKAVIDSKCLGCHNGSIAVNFAGMNNSKAISSGWIVPKDPANSKLYYRLQGSVSSNPASKNMPENGSISSAEVQAVYDWIANIK